jgi:hypothetical protein
MRARASESEPTSDVVIVEVGRPRPRRTTTPGRARIAVWAAVVAVVAFTVGWLTAPGSAEVSAEPTPLEWSTRGRQADADRLTAEAGERWGAETHAPHCR